MRYWKYSLWLRNWCVWRNRCSWERVQIKAKCIEKPMYPEIELTFSTSTYTPRSNSSAQLESSSDSQSNATQNAHSFTISPTLHPHTDESITDIIMTYLYRLYTDNTPPPACIQLRGRRSKYVSSPRIWCVTRRRWHFCHSRSRV